MYAFMEPISFTVSSEKKTLGFKLYIKYFKKIYLTTCYMNLQAVSRPMEIFFLHLFLGWFFKITDQFIIGQFNATITEDHNGMKRAEWRATEDKKWHLEGPSVL